MQPFNSVMSCSGHFKPLESSCEMITFDSEHLNVFAAEVVYCQPHWHDAPELIYVLRGEFEITVHQMAMAVKAGEYLYIGPDIIHSLEQTQVSSALVTWQFAPSLFDLMHAAPNGYLVLSKEKNGYDGFHGACFAHLASLSPSGRSSFEQLANIYKILAKIEKHSSQDSFKIYAEKSKEERVIRDSIDYINCHFHEAISVTTLAEHANISYFHFSRVFKKICGITPAEYIAKVRVNMAKSLLKNIHIPITDISHSVGFNEHRLMIAAFRKYSFETPSAYRKRFLSDPDWCSTSCNLINSPNRPIKIKDVFHYDNVSCRLNGHAE